jgi:DHA3 family macrolide efflux protein-like MFS transporter
VTAESPTSGRSASDITTWSLLRSERVFAWFMAGLAPGAVVIGIIAVSRTVLATQLYGDESGIARTAIASGLAGAAAGLIAGSLVDRWNARWILLISMTGLGLSQVLLAALYATGSLTPAGLIGLTLADGFLVGVQVTALLTTQAGLVASHARGAAEITNTLRIGVGSAIGALIASSLLSVEAAIALAAVITLLVTAITGWTSRSFTPAHRRAGAGLSEVIATLRPASPLRSTVVINILLALVLPTQLVNFFIVDKNLSSLLGAATIAGLIGVLGARLHLSATGLRGSLVRRVRIAYLVFVITMIGSFLILLTRSDAAVTVSFVPLIVIGSWSSTLAFGLVTATVQQRLPDEVRGRFTGGLNAVLNLCVVGGVITAGLVITPQSIEVFLPVLVAALVLVFAGTKGFTGLGSRVEST